MTCARSVGALVAGLLVPCVVNAQGANAKPDAASPTAERLPIYDDRFEEPDLHRRGRQRPAHTALDSQGNQTGVEREAAGAGTVINKTTRRLP